MSLIIIGSLAFDTIETPHGRREKIIGGSGTYCALAASFFTRPKVVSVVGEDFPQEAIDFFRKKNIDLEGLKFVRGKTFHWVGRYEKDPNLRTTLKTELNVLKDFHPRLPSSYRQAEIVFLANIDPDLHEEVLAQMKNPKIVAMDSIKYWIEAKGESLGRALKKVDIFFANDEEVKLITGEISLIKAGKRLLEKGPSLVAVKKGEHGALILGRDFVFGVLAHPCEEVIDPTGAGDSFAGGFLGYLDNVKSASQREIRRAAVYGSVMASFAIEDFGIERFKSLQEKEIEARFRHFKRLVSF